MPVSTDDLLDQLFDRPIEQGVSLAFVATHRGDVVAERYGTQPANDFQEAQTITAASTLLSWSMAKSITHAAVGVLVGEGLLDVDAPAPVPSWSGTDKEQITLNQLLEMRPGLTFVEDYVDGEVSNCIEMLFSGTAPSFAQYAADLPLTSTPGTVFNYSSGTTNIVSRIVGDVVCRKADVDGSDPATRERAVTEFLHDRVFAPAGMTSAIPKFDDAGDFVGSSYVYATARDFARFGELYARDGIGVDGERVVPEGWVEHGAEVTAHDDSGLDYGRHWWSWPAFPGSFACHGYEGQYVVVIPDHQLVIAHLGKTDIAHAPGLRMRLARLIDSLLGTC